MAKIIKYIEILEVLGAITKHPSAKKHDKDGLEDKNGKSKHKTKKCHKKILRLRAGRER